jgi:hypothetical protein
MSSEADALLEIVRKAFENVPRGQLSMHQAHIVKWADDKRLAEAAKLDADQHWTEISDQTIEEARNALNGADPVSWRYFLPAYLSWTLRNFKTSGSFVCDQTIYAFQVYEIGQPLRRESVLRFDTLSLAQRRAVCVFLRYMAAHSDQCDGNAAWEALEAYWGQYCPGFTA